MELSYAQLKSASDARESEEQRQEHRKRSLILLIHDYLNDQGYLTAASALIDESGIPLNKYAVCDNIDLETVLQEYNTYYNIKFGRNAKIVKKVEQLNGKSNGVHRKGSQQNLPRISESSNGDRSGKKEKRKVRSAEKKDEVKSLPGASGKDREPTVEQEAARFDMGLTGTAVTKKPEGKRHHKGIIDVKQILQDAIRGGEDGQSMVNGDDKLLKPLAMFANRDMRELAATISRDIYLNNPNVKWGDIFGLEAPKRIMKEAVVYPIKYPQLFTGILSPWKGLLLYGPPGTGKTLLAKAVATECNTTFFNISASSIVSKWRGDSEKLVRVLFELARYHAPATIFIDELESLISQRGSSGTSTEHEGSLRMKTELLVQMDGLAKSNDLVFLLAASNLPWELDHAMLRRLEKRILVDLPTREARKQMFKHHLPPVIHPEGGMKIETQLNYDYLAESTEGYTGSDIQLVCKEAVMRRVRKIFTVLEDMEANPDNSGRSQKHLHKPRNYDHVDNGPSPESQPLLTPRSISKVQKLINIEPVTTADVEAALCATKPSARNLGPKYEAWQKEYEST